MARPFAASLVAAVIFATLGLGSTAYVATRKQAISHNQQQLDARANAGVTAIRSELDRFETSTRLIASKTKLRELLRDYNDAPSTELQAAMSAILVDAAANTHQGAEVSLADPSGTVVASSRPQALDTSLSEGALGFDGLPALGAPIGFQRVLSDNDLVIYARAPVESQDEAIGLIQVKVDAADLARVVHAARFDRTGEVVVGVLDPDTGAALYIAPNETNGVAANGFASSTTPNLAMARALTGQQGTWLDDVVDYDERPVLAAGRFIPEIEMGLVVKIDRDEAFEEVRSIRNTLIVAGLLVISLSAAAALVACRSVRSAQQVSDDFDARLKTLLGASPVALLAAEVGGEIMLVNDRATQLLGVPEEELLGQRLDDLIPIPDSGDEWSYIPDEPDTETVGYNANGQVNMVTNDGRELTVAISFAPVEIGGVPYDVTALMDLTERVQAAQELARRTFDLEQVNEDLNRFASLAAHDLKAPVRGMGGLAQLMLEDYTETLPDDAKETLAHIVDRSNRLVDMVDGLLQYARIGQLNTPSEWIATEQMLDDIIDLYVPSDRFTVTKQPLAPIYGSAVAVEVVFRNILSNAVKHHDREHGTIAIDCGTEGNQVWFTISDDGPGIPEKYRKQVFEMFTTLRPKERSGGSGLGLSLVKKSMERDGGTIEISSEEGRGTTFRVAWPQPSNPPRELSASKDLLGV